MASGDVRPYSEFMDEMTEPEVAPTNAGEETPRLRRSSTKKLVGGVAGGLSERFEFDVNIVRVLFVVLACLWGIGVAIYLAMWVLIPRDSSSGDETLARSQLPMATSRWPYVALAAAIIVLALIFSTTAGGVPRVGPGLAILWLIFLAALAVFALRRPAQRWTFRRFVAMMFLTGLSFVIVISGLFLGIVGVIGVPMKGGSGVRVVQPTSLSATAHSYETAIGSSTVDLTSVNFPARGFEVSASVAVGLLNVVVPANAIVDLRTHVGIGAVRFVSPDGYPYSSFTGVPATLSSAQSRTSAPHLIIDAQVGIGEIQVTRAIH